MRLEKERYHLIMKVKTTELLIYKSRDRAPRTSHSVVLVRHDERVTMIQLTVPFKSTGDTQQLIHNNIQNNNVINYINNEHNNNINDLK